MTYGRTFGRVNPNIAHQQRAARTSAPTTGGSWVLPVVGMRNEPSAYEGGAPAWATGSYGYQKPASKGGHTHQGVDIYAVRGTPVVAPVGGVVKAIGSGGVSGNYVKVAGDDGYEYYYAHLESVHSSLSQGMRVRPGSYLGGIGNTGNATGTDPHLHFEVRRGGKSRNPNAWLRSGRTQDNVPLSRIPNLTTPDQLQALVEEMQYASHIIDPRMSVTEALATQEIEPAEGRSMYERGSMQQAGLGGIFDGISQALSGGQRTPLPKSTALEATQSTALEEAAVGAEDLGAQQTEEPV